MPARITVRAELQSLLNKSQELTDANRQAQLRREADRREDRKRLAAKKAKEDAAQKKPLEDPVGRNILTAAMGQPGVQVGRVFVYRSLPLNVDNSPELRVWSGDGLQAGALPIEWHAPGEVIPWVTVPPELISETPTVYRFTNNSVYVFGGGLKYSFAGGDYTLGVDTLPEYPVIEVSSGYDGPVRTHVLPLGRSECIVVFTYNLRLYAYLEVNISGTPTVIYDIKEEYTGEAAFFVNRTVVREVPVPVAILERPSWLDGAPSSDYYYSGPESYGDARYWLNDVESPLEYVKTPSSFLWFGETNRAVLEANFGNPPASVIRGLLPAGVNNFRSTAFYDNSQEYDYDIENEPFTLVTGRTGRQWAADDPSPVVESFPPTDNRWRRVNVQPVPDTVLPANPDPDNADSFFVRPFIFWDWGKAGWCREQLLALGFTADDLVAVPPPP
jgi:hypothetical protein